MSVASAVEFNVPGLAVAPSYRVSPNSRVLLLEGAGIWFFGFHKVPVICGVDVVVAVAALVFFMSKAVQYVRKLVGSKGISSRISDPSLKL